MPRPRKVLGYTFGVPIYEQDDASQEYGVAGVGVRKPGPPSSQFTDRYGVAGAGMTPLQDMSLPGVGGPATTAQVVATNAAAAARAAAAAPFRPKKKPTAKKSAPAGAGGTGGGAGAGTPVPTPVATPTAETTSDGTYDWFRPDSYYTEQARAGLQGDIDVTRAQYDRQQEALRAQQEGAARLLADFGKSVSGYYSDAATRAGQGYDTQAAAQALLGALGQRAFTGQGAGSIASDLAAAGNNQLGQALASQETGRNATVGAILNRIVGTDKASEFLTASRNATRAALSNAAAQNTYGQRLLQGLNVQQQNALNELLGRRSDFEAKIPGMVAQRASEMSNQAAKNMLAAQAFGLDVQKQNDLVAYRQATLNMQERKIAASAARASSLSPSQQQSLQQRAASKAAELAQGKYTQATDGQGNVTRVTWSKQPVKNYQQALKQLEAAAPRLPLDYYTGLLNQYWTTPGKDGRPFIDAATRDALVRAGYDEGEVYAAAFDEKKAAAFADIIRGMG